jgi:hypothetical protein
MPPALRRLRPVLIGSTLWLLALGCGPRLPDSYEVYDAALTDRLDAENVLMCKLGCADDVQLPRVSEVEWNDQLMYVTTGPPRHPQYYILRAAGPALACCQHDSLLGPLTPGAFRATVARQRWPARLPHRARY